MSPSAESTALTVVWCPAVTASVLLYMQAWFVFQGYGVGSCVCCHAEPAYAGKCTQSPRSAAECGIAAGPSDLLPHLPADSSRDWALAAVMGWDLPDIVLAELQISAGTSQQSAQQQLQTALHSSHGLPNADAAKLAANECSVCRALHRNRRATYWLELVS